ncbi:RNA recognition motif [Paludibacter jiangxiensis]|uniref:RNA recognition motif n=2 Tax=Paludibacter jiangxiensis TaxID=681398 RepID=A0A161LEL5_9BACT|nr:RNA recognition motif [Paludibacter jiangxiensis]
MDYAYLCTIIEQQVRVYSLFNPLHFSIRIIIEFLSLPFSSIINQVLFNPNFKMNIFVAKLSFNVNSAELGELFTEFGEVTSATVITDKMTGRSKGFGFVEMPDNDAAKLAISKLNDAEVDGRTIAVSEARPREERPYGERRQGGYQGGGNRGGYGDRSRRY